MKDFPNYIAKITKGFFTDEKIDEIIGAFETASSFFYFDNEAEANLIRIINSLFDKIFFLDECSKFPSHSEILCAVASNSNYLSDIIVSSPGLLYLLIDTSFLSQSVSSREIKIQYSTITKNIKTFNSRINFLKSLQRRYILKIGINDIIFKSSVKKTTESLSTLAAVISKLLFVECSSIIGKKYSIKSFPNNYALCALGKLGGMELNYSSDIDLILFYQNTSLGTKTKKSYHELLEETIKLFIRSMSEITEKGNLYRVDFRLRPDGSYAPLCMNVDDMINYYDIRGEDWERQMLIKLAFVAGNKNIFTYFNAFAQKYIYNLPSSISPLLSIKRMKSKIEKLYHIKGNIKTEPGGIRDIEFITQALQIINGRNNKALRKSNTLAAIQLLRKNNLLNKNESTLLTNAYIFYRHVEHFLQLMNNNQTHLLPDKHEVLAKLSLKLRFDNIEDFKNRLTYYRKNVREFFNALTNESEDKSEQELMFFQDIQKAKNNLRYLSSGSGIIEQNAFDNFTSGKFDEISEIITRQLSHCSFPDRALDNFVKLTKTNHVISSWYSYLKNENLIRDILHVCEFSQFTIDNIWMGKELSTTTIANEFFTKQSENFKEFNLPVFRSILAAQFALGFINADELTRAYSKFIHSKLSLEASLLKYKNDFCLISLGSLSAGEMNLFSDIDLIVVVNDFENCSKVEREIINFLKTTREKLQNTKIDLRLRPEGKNSFLVFDIKNHLKYLRSRAGIWEFQTLLKNKFLYGNHSLYNDFILGTEEIQKSIPRQRILEESRIMYDKLTSNFNIDINLGFDIKKSKGGFLTIDFLLSFLILYEKMEINYRIGLPEKIELLCNKNNEFSDLDELTGNYSFLKNILIWQQVFFNKSNTRLLEESQNSIFAKLLGFKDEKEFKYRLDFVIHSNSSLINKYIFDK
ncbi:MAG: hypothetical protein CO129_10540 [Ignavibacteriales bacterium CG_4_9_14_3_um_filter_34_10]|nr:MAG: hypothetical protein CO129_10540 [Ignavibacteriales bacterium CG_4_9_14_3_um_filter_34_10]